MTIKRALSFGEYVKINEDATALQSQKQQLANQMQELQKKMVEIDQQIINDQKTALSQPAQAPAAPGAVPGASPAPAAGGETVSESEEGTYHTAVHGKSKSKTLQIIDIEDDNNVISVYYKIHANESDEKHGELSKAEFMKWYNEFIASNYSKDYVASFNDPNSLWTAESYEDQKELVRQYLLDQYKKDSAAQQVVAEGKENDSVGGATGKAIESLPNGEMFARKAGGKVLYTKGSFDKSTGKYECGKESDISASISIKKGTIVFPV